VAEELVRRTYQVIEQVFPARAHLQSLADPFSAECIEALNCPLPPRNREEEGYNIRNVTRDCANAASSLDTDSMCRTVRTGDGN